MRILYAKNNKYYSKLMMKVEGSPVSHVGILFFNDSLDIVIDCTKPYGKRYPLEAWVKKYEIVLIQEIPMVPRFERDCMEKVRKACVGTPYDWGAYWYAWCWGLRHLITKEPYPDRNKWATEGGMWCSEIFNPIKPELKSLGIDITDVHLDAKTPWMVYNIFKERGVKDVCNKASKG